MKHENLIFFAFKRLLAIAAIVAGFLGFVAAWRFLDKGATGFFAPDFTREGATVGVAFIGMLTLAIWSARIVTEVLKRGGFDLDTVGNNYKGPDERLRTRALKKLMSNSLAFGALTAAAVGVQTLFGIAPIEAFHTLEPEIEVLAIALVALVLADLCWKAVSRKFRPLKPKPGPRHLP